MAETLTMAQIREYVISRYEDYSDKWRAQVGTMPDDQVMAIYNRCQEYAQNPLDGLRPDEDSELLRIIKGGT